MKRERTVLVVDDDEDTLDLLKVQLGSNHFEVFTATNAEEGLDLLDDHEEIRVLLADLDLGRDSVDGPGLLLKARDAHPQVMRLVISGRTDAAEILEAVNLGHIFSYIRKPWKKEELVITLMNCFEVCDVSRERDDLLLRSHRLNGDLLRSNERLDRRVKERDVMVARIREAVEKLSKEPGFKKLDPSVRKTLELIRELASAT